MHQLDEHGRLIGYRLVNVIPASTEIDQMIAEMPTRREHVERSMIQLINDAQCYESGDPQHSYCLQDPHRPDKAEMEVFGLTELDWNPTLRF